MRGEEALRDVCDVAAAGAGEGVDAGEGAEQRVWEGWRDGGEWEGGERDV